MLRAMRPPPRAPAASEHRDPRKSGQGLRSPLRIALVSEYYYPDVGGMPEHVHHLARALTRRGHRVTIVTTAFPDAEAAAPAAVEPAVEVVRLGRASGALITNGSVSRAAVGLGLAARLSALFRARQFDVIHVHAPIFPTLALLAIRCAPPRSLLVGTLHTHFTESAVLRLFRRPLQRYLDALDGLIAVSPSALASMRAIGFRCDAEIIPNGVDLAYWQSGRPLPEFSDGHLHLLVQARLEPRNHIGTIIDALRQLRADGAAIPKTRLLVVGDGPQRAELEARAAGLQVRFLGARIDGRADLAATSDVYCFSAAIASHPMSLLEGMAAGRPVLTHAISGARELVTGGVEGFIVPLGDVREYAQALRLLLGSAARRAAMGDAARRRVEGFGWETIAAQIEDQYLMLLRGTRAPARNASDECIPDAAAS